MEEEKATGRLSQILRIGGYLIAGGALMGFSAGLYLLFNHALFSFFIRIGPFEVMSYFLGVFIPSFIILIVVGYVFATTLGPKRTDLSSVMPLCVLSLLCMVLSALSVFYLISFLGGLLALTALVKAYTKPAFKTLSKREAFFMVEIGALFVAYFSSLSLVMWLISNAFQTYAMGLYASYSPYALLLVGVFSLLMFFVIPLIGSRGTNAGLCGALGLAMSILSYLFVVQNRYAFFNAPASIGLFMLILGFISALVGELLYVRIFLSETPEAPTAIITSPILYHGAYCSYCGKPRDTTVQNLCSYCGRSLMWTPYAPFCSSCGRLVPTNAQACPHCQEDIRNKRIYFYSMDAQEQAIASKIITESRKKKSRIMKELPRVLQMLHLVGQALWGVYRFFGVVIERLSLTLKEAVFIMILTYLFGFLSFIGYVRVVPSRLDTFYTLNFSYGFPLEWLEVKSVVSPFHFVYEVGFVWVSLALDVMLYFLVSFALVYAVARWRR